MAGLFYCGRLSSTQLDRWQAPKQRPLIDQPPASPFPTHILLTKNQRLPFVWLKCSVGILRSRLRVIGTEKWNRVMTVSVGYPGTTLNL